MSAMLLDERQYRKLLDETLPVVIRTVAEYDRLLATARALMEKPEDEVTEEEGRLLELLGVLIEEDENRAHPLPKSRVSEILSGKRSISKTQARQLAEVLRVPIDLFV